MEYSLNIFQNSPEGRIHEIRGIEPLIRDMLQVQLVFSSEYSHVGQSVTMFLSNWKHSLRPFYFPLSNYSELLHRVSTYVTL